jgi:hypothetical protein
MDCAPADAKGLTGMTSTSDELRSSSSMVRDAKYLGMYPNAIDKKDLQASNRSRSSI